MKLRNTKWNKKYFTFDAAKPLLKLRLHFRFARHEVLSFLRGLNVNISMSSRNVMYAMLALMVAIQGVLY